MTEATPQVQGRPDRSRHMRSSGSFYSNSQGKWFTSKYFQLEYNLLSSHSTDIVACEVSLAFAMEQNCP